MRGKGEGPRPLYLPYISPVSPLYLVQGGSPPLCPSFRLISPPYLPCVSPVSPLYLACEIGLDGGHERGEADEPGVRVRRGRVRARVRRGRVRARVRARG